tara:strand:- start:46 stop:777 length:732 start_codon:yes stop_codon:yes gene_type:complete
MNKVFIFDVDGTLTPSRQRMTEKFAKFFDVWSNKNKYYLVTGSDLDKTKEQLPIAYIDRAQGIFTCCGNQFYMEDKLIYENKFKPSDDLLKYLEDTLDNSDYPVKAGVHIEDRGSMVNFSIVGRKCTLQQRKDYFEYDKLTGERENIVKHIIDTWEDLDAVIGGQISIDIYPKGKDKAQVLEHIEKRHETGEIIFIGDKIESGGNDYPLALLMDNIEGCDWHQVEDYRKTWWLLQRYELGLEK